jgi:hypothetical protein
MSILEFKKKEEPKTHDKMNIIELIDEMVEEMFEFVAHYEDDFLPDATYQAILSKRECEVMDDLVEKCMTDALTLMTINDELKMIKDYQGEIMATYGAVIAFQMAVETVKKINLLNEEANGRVQIGDFNVSKVEIIKKILPKFEGQYNRVDYDSLEEVSNGFYPFILVDIEYDYDLDDDILYMIGFKNKTDGLKYALSQGIKGTNLIQMWG